MLGYFTSHKLSTDDADSVLSFYRELNDWMDKNNQNNNFYIEEVSSLGGHNVSTVATFYSKALGMNLITDWEVNVMFETIGELVDEITRQQAKCDFIDKNLKVAKSFTNKLNKLQWEV